MHNVAINLVFDCFTIHQYTAKSIMKKCISAVLQDQNINIPCEINVLVTNDAGIREINRVSRNIDKPTDVLSFPMFSMNPLSLPQDWSEYTDPETGFCALGDMVISLERAISQAKEFGHGIRREIGYLTIHSMLHLLGYDHEDEGPEKALMRQQEERIASGIPGLQR